MPRNSWYLAGRMGKEVKKKKKAFGLSTGLLTKISRTPRFFTSYSHYLLVRSKQRWSLLKSLLFRLLLSCSQESFQGDLLAFHFTFLSATQTSRFQISVLPSSGCQSSVHCDESLALEVCSELCEGTKRRKHV
jgi:hypothetical protein